MLHIGPSALATRTHKISLSLGTRLVMTTLRGIMSDETPTERFDPVEPAGTENNRPEKSKPIVLILSIVGTLFLLVIVALLVILFSRGSGDTTIYPTNSATPSVSPSMTPSATPSATQSSGPSGSPESPPEATAPRFTQLNVPSSQMCSAGGPGVAPTRPTVTVSWSTAGAVEAWFINGTDDAKDSGFMQIPLSGDQGDFPNEQTVECSDGSNVYTITLVGPDGTHVSKSWTVAITGDNF